MRPITSIFSSGRLAVVENICMENTSGLKHQIYSEPEKKQLQSVSQLLEEGETGLEILLDWMLSIDLHSHNLALGKAYQALYSSTNPQVQKFLAENFANGVVPLESEKNIDYQPLQELLAQSDFQGADVMTLEKMCELAGSAAVARKWIYFTEVESFPVADLHTLDRLWLMFSEGRFGFSVQRKIWLGVGKDYGKLWPKIDWKSANIWTRYPKEFQWDKEAPIGHLPLSNQLRGVRTIDAIFAHPAWKKN